MKPSELKEHFRKIGKRRKKPPSPPTSRDPLPNPVTVTILHPHATTNKPSESNPPQAYIYTKISDDGEIKTLLPQQHPDKKHDPVGFVICGCSNPKCPHEKDVQLARFVPFSELEPQKVPKLYGREHFVKSSTLLIEDLEDKQTDRYMFIRLPAEITQTRSLLQIDHETLLQELFKTLHDMELAPPSDEALYEDQIYLRLLNVAPPPRTVSLPPPPTAPPVTPTASLHTQHPTESNLLELQEQGHYELQEQGHYNYSAYEQPDMPEQRRACPRCHALTTPDDQHSCWTGRDHKGHKKKKKRRKRRHSSTTSTSSSTSTQDGNEEQFALDIIVPEQVMTNTELNEFWNLRTKNIQGKQRYIAPRYTTSIKKVESALAFNNIPQKELMAYFRAYNMICKQESIGDYVKYSRASVSAKFTLRALQEKGKKDTIASLKQGAPILPNKNIENLTKQHVVDFFNSGRMYLLKSGIESRDFYEFCITKDTVGEAVFTAIHLRLTASIEVQYIAGQISTWLEHIVTSMIPHQETFTTKQEEKKQTHLDHLCGENPNTDYLRHHLANDAAELGHIHPSTLIAENSDTGSLTPEKATSLAKDIENQLLEAIIQETPYFTEFMKTYITHQQYPNWQAVPTEQKIHDLGQVIRAFQMTTQFQDTQLADEKEIQEDDSTPTASEEEQDTKASPTAPINMIARRRPPVYVNATERRHQDNQPPPPEEEENREDRKQTTRNQRGHPCPFPPCQKEYTRTGPLLMHIIKKHAPTPTSPTEVPPKTDNSIQQQYVPPNPPRLPGPPYDQYQLPMYQPPFYPPYWPTNQEQYPRPGYYHPNPINRPYRPKDTQDSQERQGRRYKTRLCKTFQDEAKCPQGDNCTFAHGTNDLRK